MEKSYKSLLSLIVNFQLGFNRLNDVALDDDVYQIGFTENKGTDGQTVVHACLRNTKKKDYGVSEYQLAALRISTGDLTAKYLDEFKTDVHGSNLQAVAMDLLDKGKSLEDLRLKVAYQLMIKNAAVTSEVVPIYRDTCYTGVAEYSRGIRALVKGKARDFYATPEYRNEMRDLRDALYMTPLKPGMDKAENVVRIPVFKVVS